MTAGSVAEAEAAHWRLIEARQSPTWTAVVVACATSHPQAARDEAAAAALRSATGRSDIQIARRPSGRPRLDPPWPKLGVSLSHRGGVMAAAVSTAGAIGIDLEPCGVCLPDRFAHDHFAPTEAQFVALQPPAIASRLALALWVAKEAVVKRTGRGVVDGMAEPDFSRQCAELVAFASMTKKGIELHTAAAAVSLFAIEASTMGRWLLAVATEPDSCG